MQSSEETRWTLILVTQERGTKKEVSNSLVFDSRDNAVKAEEHIIAHAGRGGNLPIECNFRRERAYGRRHFQSRTGVRPPL